MVLFDGNWLGFVDRPISAVFLVVIVAVLLLPLVSKKRIGTSGEV